MYSINIVGDLFLLGSLSCIITEAVRGPSMVSRGWAGVTENVNSSTASGTVSPMMIISTQSVRELVEPVGNTKVLLVIATKSLPSVSVYIFLCLCVYVCCYAVADPEEVHGVPRNPPFSHCKPRIAC